VRAIGSMPSSHEILEHLTVIANEWRSIAIAWHAVAGAFLIGLLIGWRPSSRVVGIAVAVSTASVSALAWNSGNPFNGALFGVLTMALAGLAIRLPSKNIELGSRAMMMAGMSVVAFGWVYPHFLETRSSVSYLYEAPLGLIPCPTLSAAIGLTLVAGLSGARTWSAVLAAAGILYGLIGVFRLGVLIDVALLAGGLGLAAISAREVREGRKRKFSIETSHAT
jgi:hypothetical protein